MKKEVLSETVHLFEIEAPKVARKRKPGQFIIYRIHEEGERIPVTIADANPDRGTITIIVQGIGKSTNQLLELKEGDSLLDVCGPLGKPTHIENFGTCVCLGGGVGIAEAFPLARALKEAGNKVYSIIGARTKDLLICEEQMREASDFLHVTTDDGSYQRKGFVTDVLKDLLEGEKIDFVLAIGPVPMMRAVCEVTRPYGIKTMVSLNPIMLDGTGMCGGCRVTIDGETKFACVDGPEFDGHQVDFNELTKRQGMYLDDEKRSREKWEREKCRALGGAEPG